MAMPVLIHYSPSLRHAIPRTGIMPAAYLARALLPAYRAFSTRILLHWPCLLTDAHLPSRPIH